MRPNTVDGLLARTAAVPGPFDTPCRVYPVTDRLGYARVKLSGRTVSLHRAAWEQANGPIHVGLDLDHLCRNRSCAAVDHLEPVTHRENVLRGRANAATNARKTICDHGHPLDGDNLHVARDGERVCRACARRRVQEWKARQCQA